MAHISQQEFRKKIEHGPHKPTRIQEKREGKIGSTPSFKKNITVDR